MAAGSVVVRATGACFSLINLAFNRVGWFLVMSPLKSITGGENGLSIRNLSLGLFDFRDSTFRFLFVLVSLIFVFLLLRIITSSSYGVLLRSIKENEKRVRFLGYNTYFYKWINFVIAASVAGFAGALTALNYGYINPNVLDVNSNPGVVFACLIGGPGRLYGANCWRDYIHADYEPSSDILPALGASSWGVTITYCFQIQRGHLG